MGKPAEPEGQAYDQRVKASFSPEQIDWIREHAHQLRCSIPELIRRVVSEAMRPGGTQVVPAPRTDRREPKERFLEALQEHFHISEACRVAGVARAEVEAWRRSDSDFETEIGWAREVYIDAVERVLVEMAKGARKGNPMPAIAFLNSHSPYWGRLKAELLQRAFGPIFNGLIGVVREELPPAKAEELIKKFKAVLEVKFSQYSD